MKKFAILIICFLFTGISAQNTQKENLAPQVSELAWMSGCWVQSGKNERSFVSENWTKPFGMMIGTNRSVRDGKVRAFEYLRIEAREKEVFYVAKPSKAAAETSFKLVSLKRGKAVFENKEHDFPKRIIYSLSSPDKLSARVEDDDKGFGQVFNKVSCDG